MMGNSQALPANGGQGPEGKLGLTGPCSWGYFSSRKVSLGSRLCSSSPQLQAAPGVVPADARPTDNPLLQPYPRLIAERTGSNTRPPRALKPSPASPRRCFFAFVQRKEGKKGKKGWGPCWVLFLHPVLEQKGLHSAADDVLFPSHGLCLPPPMLERRDHFGGAACPHIPRPPPARDRGNLPTPWLQLGGQGCGRTRRMLQWHCCSPCICHNMAGSILPGHICARCECAWLVISEAGHMQDPKEMSPPLP